MVLLHGSQGRMSCRPGDAKSACKPHPSAETRKSNTPLTLGGTKVAAG
jgi:hypothetical protein